MSPSTGDTTGSTCLSVSYALLCFEALLVIIHPSSLSSFVHYAGAVLTFFLAIMHVSVSWFIVPFMYVPR